jgi:hypothetical protein
MEFPIKMKLDTFYKAILTLSAIILVLSLFIPFEPQIEIYKLKVLISSVYWILYSVVAWFIDDKMRVFFEYTPDSTEKKKIAVDIAISQYIVLAIFVTLFVIILGAFR